ncbi:HOX_3 [Mytilus edulis]|uniref:HOX_3 n=1 Tax=Mytilus edulis TaxID=6550 RepID=A0A8S3TWV8_MYTED|nr:HOX_3 [Mytilus edulis]
MHHPRCPSALKNCPRAAGSQRPSLLMQLSTISTTSIYQTAASHLQLNRLIIKRDCISPGSCSDDSDKSDQPKKRGRTSYTNSQLLELERYYSNSKYLQIEDRPVLARKLKLSQHKIKWWFQNRRMKEKRHIKSTSYNGSPELSQFVGVGKPGSRMITTMESNGNFSQQSYSPFPMVSPHTYGMSPFVYPGYSQQFYGSVFPQAVQHNRS